MYLALATGIASGATEFAQFRSSGPEPRFAMEYPAWEAKKPGSRFGAVSVVRRDRHCYFDVDVANLPLDQFQQVVQNYMRQRGATILSGSPLSYQFATQGGKLTFLARTRGMDCAKNAYLATMTCLREDFDQAAADAAFASMRCGAQASAGAPSPGDGASPDTKAAPATKGGGQVAPSAGRAPALGIVVSPAGEFNAQSVEAAYRIARDGGARMTRFYVHWTEIEPRKGARNWRGTDYMMQLVRGQGLRVSVAFHTIRTAIRGPLPADIRFAGWNDRELIDRFGDFVVDFLRRYPDVVDYVEIGSEVNGYFARHPDEIAPYRTFFGAVRDRIKREFPAVKTGMVFAFHEMQAKKDFSVYEALRVGDFDGFTLYVMGANLTFDRAPREVFESLQEMARVTGNRPFAVEEVGWSAWPGLGGTEASQRAAVDAVFDFLEQAPERLLFLNWFNLHDGRRQDCERIARTFVKAGDAMSRNAGAMQRFSDYLCYLGLRTNDGKPRPAWDEWTRRARALQAR
jgi:hypothetical protein